MKWVKYDKNGNKVPIKSWCEDVDQGALDQANNLSNHPAIFKHVALMPDCHKGYGIPIGGVVATIDVVIPNGVGVDIGCGMVAVETDFDVENIENKQQIRDIVEDIKKVIPVGEGKHHKKAQNWGKFDKYLEQFKDKELPGWFTEHIWSLAKKNLGTLGGGNHFIELQKSDKGKVWLMLHSGSRNLGYQIAKYYHKKGLELNKMWHSNIPDKDLAFLPINTQLGRDYIRDMQFALEYALKNRAEMMKKFKEVVKKHLINIEFIQEINIHHNYVSLENHFGENVWVHRKGATSAKEGELGIIPGSMGTASYIVKGLGNIESFMSCSHGAGRVLGRKEASRTLSIDECNKAMEGVVFDRWSKVKGRDGKKVIDLSESPLAYKDIDEVIKAELDLIEPIVKLLPIGVVKG